MPPASDPADLAASELVDLFRRRRLSPVEAVTAVLARIARHNGTVNAYCHLDEDGALAAAKASEARWMKGRPKGLVDGVPVGVKDNIAVCGMPSRFGSRLTPDRPQTFNAPVTARLKEQGAVLIGKTAMPEYGWKATSDSPLTGLTRNPWDLNMTTGGSSAGGAAACVLGMGALQLGTDGGGSIRIPAGFSGCFGLKPTRQRVPCYPASPLATLAHHGPLTRTVGDSALAMTVIAAPDARDVYGWISPAPDYRVGLNDGVAGLLLAYSPRLGALAARLDPDVERLVAAAVKVFEELGAHLEEADPDLGREPIDVWDAFWWPGMALQLEPFGESAQQRADPGLIAELARGAKTTAREHILAQLKRAELHVSLERFHARYHLLLTPTLPLPAFEVGHTMPPSGGWGKRWTDWAPFSYPFNLTQQPAASVPCGLTPAGLPVGLQILGPIGADDRVLRACQAFQSAKPFAMLSAPRRS